MSKATNIDEPQSKRRPSVNLIYEPKLNWHQVNEIRKNYVFGSKTHGTKALATLHSVSPNTIHKIVHGKMWKITPGDGNVPPPLKGRVTPRQFFQALSDAHQKAVALREQTERLAESYPD